MTRQISNVTRETSLTGKSTNRNKKKKIPLPPPPPKRETTLKTSRYQTGRLLNNKPNNLPNTLSPFLQCTHVKDVDLFSCSSFKSPSLLQKETLPLHCMLTLSNQELIPRNSFQLAKLFNQKKIKQRHIPAQFNTLVRNFKAAILELS